MKRLARAFLTVSILAAGCGASGDGTGAEAPAVAIPELSVDDVARLIDARAATVVDANGERTRREQGTVPGAVLLTSSSQYDCAAELPADRGAKLVFYCGGTACTASDTAAERARDAGWRDVAVMRPGIRGWRDAGKPTAPFPQS